MLFYLSQYVQDWAAGSPWEDPLSFLRVFRYISFRTGAAALTALAFSLWFGPKVILWLKELRFGQEYTDKAEEAGGMIARVLSKKGTPTMGGVLIVTVVDLTALLWTQWNELLILALLSFVMLAGLGFYDDYAKITLQTNRGTTARLKLIVQTLLALGIGLYLWKLPATSRLTFLETNGPANPQTFGLISDIMIPFYKYPLATGVAALGLLVTVLAIVGSSNAVNLTDGLDGLAIGCTLIVTTVFLVMTYVASNSKIAGYLQIPFVAGSGELTVLCAAILGAGLGFLWFNCHPAQVFMGDTGSLALGGVLGIIAVLIHQPFILFIAGGVFVAEAFSSLLQTAWFKYTRRRYGTGVRLFRMAPLHHHFEKKGWYESQVVTRFYILCILCAVVALTSLKLR